MCTTVGRVFTGLTRLSLTGGILFHKAATNCSLKSVRPLALSSQRRAKSKKPPDDREVNDEPLKYLTSKASHRTWKVERSMGSQFQRPWWKVLPISLFATAFLLWCALREETDIDAQLERALHESLPGLNSDEEEEQSPDQSS